MAEELKITATGKEAKYTELLPQVRALVADEPDLVANMANISAALRSTMNFFWVGFYLVKKDVLVLGPFQGPVACTRIGKGKGVCGSAWANQKTVIVPDVNRFPGHIACNSQSKSEIVLPLFSEDGTVAGVLDVDSDVYGSFDATDEKYLKQIVQLLKL